MVTIAYCLAMIVYTDLCVTEDGYYVHGLFISACWIVLCRTYRYVI